MTKNTVSGLRLCWGIQAWLKCSTTSPQFVKSSSLAAASNVAIFKNNQCYEIDHTLFHCLSQT